MKKKSLLILIFLAAYPLYSEINPEKKNVEQCIEGLRTDDAGIQILHLQTCGKKHQKDQKMQNALLELLERSNDNLVKKQTLFLLANKEKDFINKKLVELSQKENFQKPELQYVMTLVVFSNTTDKTKKEEKEFYNRIKDTTDDALLKHLANTLHDEKQK